ncbi:MAG: hypothetical protein ACI4XJ_08795 [Eubacteriales bacterium]
MREYVRQHITDCGDYARVNLYPVRPVSRKRGAKKMPSSNVQQKLNAQNSAHRLSDLIHCNFTPDDVALHLTYSDKHKPETVKDAQRLAYNYMRRLARLWSKKSGEDKSLFKWIIVTEQSSTGRIHHHVIISGGLTMSDLSDKWGLGHTSTRTLEFDETGLIGLATYITKSRTSYRRWQASKNLKKLDIRENDYKVRKKDVRYIRDNPQDNWFVSQLHDGYSVCPDSIRVQDDGAIGGLFISYMIYKNDNGMFYRDKNGLIRQRRRRQQCDPK